MELTTEKYMDMLLSLPAMSWPKVSRNRKWVAWTWFGVGPTANVFVCPTDASTDPIRLSDTADNTILVNWLPDSSGIIVSQDKNGNERDQLSRIDIDQPLVFHPLTEAEPDYYIRGGDLHPNGRWLIYGANFDS